MSDETYYTVLSVSESASLSEIKTAYRDLIKQVHPDTIATLAPYLKRIAEDKAKEINEAYSVLSNSSKRRDYDNQLATYRRQNAPSPPPPSAPPPPNTPPPAQSASQNSWNPYCKCGTLVYASGFCPTCNKVTAPPKPTVRLGAVWAPIVIISVVGGAIFLQIVTSDPKPSTPPATTETSFNNTAKTASGGPYSAYPCDSRDKVSPIDGKPCGERQGRSVPAMPGYNTKGLQSAEPFAVSGTYAGTVHNETANLSSAFTLVVHEAKDGTLSGCTKVESPLYGSGILHGSVQGTRVNFVVEDITFQGDASKTEIAGSYVVTRHDGDQFGQFHLVKQMDTESSTPCEDGTVAPITKVTQFSDTPPRAAVLPPSSDLTVETSNTATLKSHAEKQTGPKEPDLSGLSYSEQQSIESVCSYPKLMEGPAAYDRCLARQLQSLTGGPKQPDLSGLSYSEQQSIESVCSYPKLMEGPAAYDRCLARQLQSLAGSPKQPDLSGLSYSEQQSIESACSYPKLMEGPAAYDRCLVRQLQSLKNYHQ